MIPLYINVETNSTYAVTSRAILHADESVYHGQLVTAKGPLGERLQRGGNVRKVVKKLVLEGQLEVEHLAFKI